MTDKKTYRLVHQHRYGSSLYQFATSDPDFINMFVENHKSFRDRVFQALKINFDPNYDTIEFFKYDTDIVDLDSIMNKNTPTPPP